MTAPIVYRCTAVAWLPPPERIAQLATPENPMEAGFVLCELGEDGDHDHAQMLWDEDAKGGAVWVRWNEGGASLVLLPWCAVLDERGDACGLFADHPSGHAWEVADPVREALKAWLADDHPHPFPGRTAEEARPFPHW